MVLEKCCDLSQQDQGHYTEDEAEDIPEKSPLPADKERKSECQ